MTLVSRVLCLRSGRSGLKFKVQGAKGQYGETNMASIKFILKVFTFASSNGQETNFSRRVRQGGTLTLCFFSIPIQVLDKNPPLSVLDLKKNGISEEGANMLAEARAT